MYESDAQVEELQALIDRSFERAGAHLLAIITPERRLSARQVVTYLQGMRHLAVATASPEGEPRVSPVDRHFLRGRFYFGTDGISLRVRHLRRNPRISVCHFVGDDVAITVHGTATIIGQGEPDAVWLDAYWVETYGSSAFDLGDDIVFVRIEPRSVITFATDPSKYPE